MMTEEEMQRIGDGFAASVILAIQQIAARGHSPDVRSNYDQGAKIGRFDVVVGDLAVYSMTIDHSDPLIPWVLQRWDTEAMRTLGMGDVADVVEKQRSVS